MAASSFWVIVFFVILHALEQRDRYLLLSHCLPGVDVGTAGFCLMKVGKLNAKKTKNLIELRLRISSFRLRHVRPVVNQTAPKDQLEVVVVLVAGKQPEMATSDDKYRRRNKTIILWNYLIKTWQP